MNNSGSDIKSEFRNLRREFFSQLTGVSFDEGVKVVVEAHGTNVHKDKGEIFNVMNLSKSDDKSKKILKLKQAVEVKTENVVVNDFREKRVKKRIEQIEKEVKLLAAKPEDINNNIDDFDAYNIGFFEWHIAAIISAIKNTVDSKSWRNILRNKYGKKIDH